MTLVTLEGVTKSFGARLLLDRVDFQLGEDERIGLVGINGGGKSTLLRILAGLEPPDEGSRVARRGARLGYLEQDPALDPTLTVRAAAAQGLGARDDVLRALDAVHKSFETAEGAALELLLNRQERLEADLERLGGHDVEHLVESTLHALGLERFEALCGQLSGGERRRVALAQLLLGRPDLLLLDEPTNHLDAFVVDWLESWFLDHRGPLLLVTHDRYFLDRVVDRIVELDRGKLHVTEGGYAEYLESRAARLSRESQAESSRLNMLRRETAWMRRGAPARTTKAKARIRRYDDLVADSPILAPEDLDFALPPGPRLGSRVLKLEGVSKSLGGTPILPRLDLELGPGERLGIVGPNGAGKSTLMKIISGVLAPDTGTREVGGTVTFMGIDQERSVLKPDATVRETVAGRGDVVDVGGRAVRAESFLDKWGFPRAQHDSLVRSLSGGERNRLSLAKLLGAGGNVLLLDEPTNDLDLATLRTLEEALLLFTGTAVIVSHDRWFLDRIATRVLYLDGKGGLRFHHGDLSGLLQIVAKESAQQKSGAVRGAAPQKSAPVAAAPSPATPKRRLSSWESKELAGIEGKIAAAERELAGVDARLADPELYQRPRTEQEAAREERARLAAAVAALYARWEELESLRG